MNVDSCLDAAAAALDPVLGSVKFGNPERLPGRGTNVVVRTSVWQGVGPEQGIVIKAMTTPEPAAREIAALKVLAAQGLSGIIPVLAIGTNPPVIVFEDLGPGPTLANRLLGTDRHAAETALIAWGAALGRLQAQTRRSREAFTAELADALPSAEAHVDRMADQTAEIARALHRALPETLGVVLTEAAADELTQIAAELAIASDECPGGLVPGDTCPNNALETDAGYVLIDFEAADYRHVVWDAAYLTVPWPSCWCSWRLPDSSVTIALNEWHTTIAPNLSPSAAERLDEDLRLATIVWAFTQLAWVVQPAARDESAGRKRWQAQEVGPPARALVQRRLMQLAELLDSRLPSLEGLTRDLRRVTAQRWGDNPLQLAPAFR